MKRLLKIVGWSLLGVVALYYVGVNVLLQTPVPELLLNSERTMAQIHFDRAWTLVPMRFEVRGLRISLQDRLVQVGITADTIRGDLRPWSLVNLRFIANHLEADGVTFRLRPRMSEGDPREKIADQLPIIEGYDTVVRDQSVLEVRTSDLRLITLDFNDLVIHHLKELWIDRVRYEGDAEVSGGLIYAPFQRLKLDHVHFADANSKLTAVEPNVATFEVLNFDVSLPETNLASFEFATFGDLDAHVHLAGATDPGFLNAYLTNVVGVPGLALHGDEGRLELDADIIKGQVSDGARLSYESKAGVRLPWFVADGVLAVKGATANKRVELEVAIADATVRRGTLSAKAQRVVIAASSSSDLREVPAIDADLTLTNLRIADLRTIDTLLPPGAGVHFANGHGRIDAHVAIGAEPQRASGDLSLVADDVVLKNFAATVAGKLELHGKVKAFNFDTNAIDLSGSTIDIDDATIRTGSTTWAKQFLHVRFDECHVKPRGPLLWTVALEVGASNLQPVYALVAANLPLPKVIGLLTDSANVRLTSTLAVRADTVSVSDIHLSSQRIGLEGGLLLKPKPGSLDRLEPWGALVLHVSPFDFGLQLAGERVALVDPKHALD